MADELTMDISRINFESPKKWKINLSLKKAKDCLEQLKELEDKWESMEQPRSQEAHHKRFKEFWKVDKKITKLYQWLKKLELSNYPITSQEELKEYIEFWEESQ